MIDTHIKFGPVPSKMIDTVDSTLITSEVRSVCQGCDWSSEGPLAQQRAFGHSALSGHTVKTTIKQEVIHTPTPSAKTNISK